MKTQKQLLKIGLAMAAVNLLVACFSPVAAIIMLWGTFVPFACVMQLKTEEK